MADDEVLRSALRERPNPLVRVKLPLWVFLIVTLLLLVLMLVLVAGKKTVDLGQGVQGAERVEVNITLCDQVAREKNVDIIKSQKDFEKALTSLGARDVRVLINKPVCPGTGLPPTSAP